MTHIFPSFSSSSFPPLLMRITSYSPLSSIVCKPLFNGRHLHIATQSPSAHLNTLLKPRDTSETISYWLWNSSLKILKPAWLCHLDPQPIFTLSVHHTVLINQPKLHKSTWSYNQLYCNTLLCNLQDFCTT